MAAILDEKSNIFLVLMHYLLSIDSCIGYKKRERVYLKQFAHKI